MVSQQSFFYSQNFVVNLVNPTIAIANPAEEIPHEKKFKKKVEVITLIIIRKGKTTPPIIRRTPKTRRKRGELIMADITNRQLNVPVQAQSPAVHSHHTNPKSLLHNAGESGTPSAD